MEKHAFNEKWTFIPLIGITLFIFLYIVATIYYPGGSNANATKEGFDWANNYWCDLLSKTAKNGIPNPGRIFSMTGMIILFLSLALFWYHLPYFFHERKRNILIIRCTGSLAMLILIFVFTRFHDSVIGIGSSISAIPMAATLSELKKYRFKRLYFLGWFCIFLIGLNFFIYLTDWLIPFLPVLQKVTLVLFLCWIILINLKCISISKRVKIVRQPKASKIPA